MFLEYFCSKNCKHSNAWFSTFFTTSPKFFGQEGDVPKIKILLKNTKPMHVYYDFFHSFCLSQYEYMSISLKLNNVIFQSRKINGFRENQADIYDRWIELASPKIISCPHIGDASPRLKNRALTLQNRPGFFGALCMISHVVNVSASLNVCRVRLSTAAYRRFRRHPRRLPVFKEFYLFPFRWCQVPAQ